MKDSSTRVGDLITLVRNPVQLDPIERYTAIGVRSFGKGIFHYESKLGAELTTLRYFGVRPNELVVSNIKAWEGAVALSTDNDNGCVASNRFLTYQSMPGRSDA